MSRILIVDDLTENRYLLDTLLRGSGYETALAANGVAALEEVRLGSVDLILTDILMPVMDGFELCRKCKEDERTKRIPLIFYTATYTEPHDEAFALSLGADRFVVKPQPPEILLALVREVLQDREGVERRAAAGPLGAEMEFFRRHNAALFKKLEDKMVELEREVRERQLAAERVRTQAEMLDLAQDAIAVKDMDHRVAYWNRSFERLTGWSAAEAIGRSVEELLHPEALVFDRATRAAVDHGGWSGELDLVAKDGRHFTVMSRWTLVRDGEGKPRSLLSINTDITEQKVLQAEFLQAQKMELVGQLAGGIAHDFNNLLSVINGVADLAFQSLRDGDPLRDDLQTIHRAGERAALLTGKLLAFSRKQIMKREVLQLGALVANLRAMIEHLIGEHRNLVISAADAGPVLADAGQMEQVILNLAVNGRDAMPEGGTLTIATRDVVLDDTDAVQHPALRPGPHVMLTVTDTGIGMDEETSRRIFEPFFTTKPLGQGTGLGLATVYGIVTQSGGAVSVITAPSKGSTFRVFLPQAAGPGPTERAGTKRTARGTETIIIVEDDEGLRNVTARALRASGFTVLTADSSKEALRRLEGSGSRIDLMLVDLCIPGISGTALAARVSETHPDVKILLTSGYLGEAGALDTAPGDTLPFLAKPFTMSELTNRVRELLDA